jgi:hypothetical protein
MSKQKELIVHDVPEVDSAHLKALQTLESAREACLAG